MDRSATRHAGPAGATAKALRMLGSPFAQGFAQALDPLPNPSQRRLTSSDALTALLLDQIKLAQDCGAVLLQMKRGAGHGD